jgi:tellurite resistance protein TehA-like permease
VTVLVSFVIALVGLYLVVTQAAPLLTMGWLLLALGLFFVVVNLYLRSRGFQMPRRRP